MKNNCPFVILIIISILISNYSIITVSATDNTEIVYINEVYSSPDGSLQWMELYNPSSKDIDISGWKLFPEYIFTITIFKNDTILKPRSYYLVCKNDDFSHIKKTWDLNKDINVINLPGFVFYYLYPAHLSLRNGPTSIDSFYYTPPSEIHDRASVARYEGYAGRGDTPGILYVEPNPTPGARNNLPVEDQGFSWMYAVMIIQGVAIITLIITTVYLVYDRHKQRKLQTKRGEKNAPK